MSWSHFMKKHHYSVYNLVSSRFPCTKLLFFPRSSILESEHLRESVYTGATNWIRMPLFDSSRSLVFFPLTGQDYLVPTSHHYRCKESLLFYFFHLMYLNTNLYSHPSHSSPTPTHKQKAGLTDTHLHLEQDSVDMRGLASPFPVRALLFQVTYKYQP